MSRGIVVAAFAMLIAWPAAVRCQSLGDARQFVQRLYAAYAKGEPDYLGPPGRTVFSPRLWRLIRRDQRRTPAGEVGALDGDPICDCQDYGPIKDLAIKLTAEGPGRARAEVRFTNLGHRETVTLALVAVQRRWMVDDVHSEGMGSLVGVLEHPD